MANNSYSPHGEQAMNRQEEIARALEREIEKSRRSRTEEGNAGGSSCTSPSMQLSTPLLKLLVECYSSMTSQRSKGCFPPPGRSRGLSPSQSVSSDSSVCGEFNSKCVEGNNPTTVDLSKTAPARPNYGRGSNDIAARGIQPRVIGQKGAAPTPNSPMQSSAPNARRGRGGASESTTIAAAIGCAPKASGCAPVKVTKKRKRKSKKPPTKIIKATSEEFCSTVQELTGLRELPAPIVRPQAELPQPERPQANAVPIGVDLDSRNPPARPDSPLTPMRTPIRSSSPPVSDRAPEATFSIHNSVVSVSSSSKSSGLNYCMGYDPEPIPFFLEEQQQDYDENLGQLQVDSPAPDSVYRYASKPMEYKKQEVSTTPASSAGASVRDAASQRSESNRKEDIPREHGCSGSNHDLLSAAPISHPFTKPSPLFVPSHRPGEPNGFETELESDQDWMINVDAGYMMADSFLICQ